MVTPTALPTAFVAGDILTAANQNLLRGGFRVLQVVFGSTAVQATVGTTTFTDTGLTATITPQAATNKILVIVNQAACYKSAGDASNGLELKLVRGATVIQQFAYLGGYTNSTVQNRFNVSTTYLDSPNTTSATTYKTQFANAVASNEVGVQVGNIAVSTITLMEISA